MKKVLLASAFIAAIATAQVASAEEATQAQLQDGTTVEIMGDAVSVVEKDGSKKPAPDGKHVLADGKEIEVKDGKLVH